MAAAHGASQHLHGVLDELLPLASDADALDLLLGGDLDAFNTPALFGSLAPGLQCSEACHRPGQRCIDPAHVAHCTKCVCGAASLAPRARWALRDGRATLETLATRRHPAERALASRSQVHRLALRGGRGRL